MQFVVRFSVFFDDVEFKETRWDDFHSLVALNTHCVLFYYTMIYCKFACEILLAAVLLLLVDWYR